FVLALSGGSTPKLYHQALVKEPIDWSKVVVVFSDERAVPPDHESNNYRMASETLLSKVPARCLRIEADDGDNRRAAAAYERRLLDTESWPVDLLILGMGDDGHTASLFPGREVEGGEWVAAAQAPPASPIENRVTFTHRAIAAARHIAALITGAQK